MAQQHQGKPAHLSRVTDNENYIRYDAEQGFNWPTSTRNINFNQRVTPSTVSKHLRWEKGPEWSGLFSLCGSQDKEDREISWRVTKGRQNIEVFQIDTTDLLWKTQRWDQNTQISYLGDENDDVMIFKATELMNVFNLSSGLYLTDRAVVLGATDEWLALEWIPQSMVTRCRRIG